MPLEMLHQLPQSLVQLLVVKLDNLLPSAGFIHQAANESACECSRTAAVQSGKLMTPRVNAASAPTACGPDLECKSKRSCRLSGPFGSLQYQRQPATVPHTLPG